jgi:predicted PurR-regulated permease PerM
MKEVEIPITVKRAIELLGIFTIGTIVFVGQSIIMPLMLAFFISLMLLPLYRLFRKIRVPEYIAIFLPILLLAIFIGLIIWLFYNQVGFLINDFPQIQVNTTKHLDNLSVWISNAFGWSPTDQLKFINEQTGKVFSFAGALLKSSLGPISGMLIFLGVLPVYIYLIILYRGLFKKFILMWFDGRQHTKVQEVIHQIETMVKSYLAGLLIQIAYIILLLGLSLALFGIKHALLIGIIFAFLNLIPYLGALIGNVLGVLITLASSDNVVDIIIVLCAITFVQFLDNNILMPRIVGYKVKINALASIVGIIIAGTMAGISGMFLAMPVIAVLKIIFDHTQKFKQWGVLLGDDRPVKKPGKLLNKVASALKGKPAN